MSLAVAHLALDGAGSHAQRARPLRVLTKPRVSLASRRLLTSYRPPRHHFILISIHLHHPDQAPMAS